MLSSFYTAYRYISQQFPRNWETWSTDDSEMSALVHSFYLLVPTHKYYNKVPFLVYRVAEIWPHSTLASLQPVSQSKPKELTSLPCLSHSACTTEHAKGAPSWNSWYALSLLLSNNSGMNALRPVFFRVSCSLTFVPCKLMEYLAK